MGIMQLLNIILFWIFFGVFSAHFAKRRGRRPFLWFFIGLFLGIFGVILLFVLPRRPFVAKAAPKAPQLQRSEAWLKMWYYLDPHSKEQCGPFEFPHIAKNWQDKTLTDKTLVWGEGMKEWKHLHDLPDLKKEFNKI
ncbi:MAG: hypothetical protein S4CHLAM45_05560 [Chlamydiales bacterium]|nr:hypothetical protein [Chlamydiales bacterium]MCH9619903.1 hypothetical protein [Chlamydiales bacterium]MCH9622670.1 hypothetical protein [Chlamydiales bacterium]